MTSIHAACVDEVRGYAHRVDRWLRGDRTDGAATGQSSSAGAGPTGAETGGDAECEAPRPDAEELGLHPREFALHVLEENDGSLKQQAFVRYDDWSASTVSRVLQKLEADGRVVRVQIGREKTVYHPDEAPAHATRSSEHDGTRVA